MVLFEQSRVRGAVGSVDVFFVDEMSFIKYNSFTETVKGGEIMKLNYTLSQYIELAKEEFCKIIKEISFVSDIEIVNSGFQSGFGDFKAVVHYDDGYDSQIFNIEVKSNGEKRFADRFIQMADQHRENNNHVCYVFAAPYISEASGKSISGKGLSYMDLSGNCYILSKRMFIHVNGKANKYVDKREKKNYFSKSSNAASVIMRTMLDEPKKSWQVKAVAELSGKSIGMVSNVKSFLKDRAFIDEGVRGEFKMINTKEMLCAWAEDYHKKNSRTLEFYSLEPIAELERKIYNWSIYHDKSALLGGFSAAARYAPTVRYKKIDVYVEQQALNEFVMDMGLKPVEYGGNVVITVPHDETPFMFYREINDSLVTSPVQTVIDLLGNAGRGEEAADSIIARVY